MSMVWPPQVVLWSVSGALLDRRLIEALETLDAALAPREPGLIWARLAGEDPAVYVDFALTRAAVTVDLVEADDELRATVAPLLAWIIDEFEASAHDHHGVNVTALILRNGARAAFLGDASGPVIGGVNPPAGAIAPLNASPSTTRAPRQSLGRPGSSN